MIKFMIAARNTSNEYKIIIGFIIYKQTKSLKLIDIPLIIKFSVPRYSSAISFEKFDPKLVKPLLYFDTNDKN